MSRVCKRCGGSSEFLYTIRPSRWGRFHAVCRLKMPVGFCAPCVDTEVAKRNSERKERVVLPTQPEPVAAPKTPAWDEIE